MTMFEYEEMSEDDPSIIKLSMNKQDVVEILAPLCKKKAEPAIDAELREEAEKIQNMRDSNLDETSDSFAFAQGEESITTAEMISEFRDIVIQTECVSEHISSSTSGIEGTATSDQSSTSVSGKMDSSPDVTLNKPEEGEKSSEGADKIAEVLGEGVTDSTASDTMEAVKESSLIARELTADDIVELYSQPPSEAHESVGDCPEVSGVVDIPADESTDLAAGGSGLGNY